MRGVRLSIGGMMLDDDDLFNDASWTSPTLDMDFTSIGPFEPQYTRTTVVGYRMNVDGELVPIAGSEPVIEKDRDE